MSDFETDVSANSEGGFDPRRISLVRQALGQGDAGQLTTLLDPLHAADIADIIEQLSSFDRRRLIDVWYGEIDGDILSEIDESIREEVIGYLPRHILTDAVRELDTDDVVDILEDLEEPQQAIILGALTDADRAAVEQALAFPDYSAGRLMQREVVVAPLHWTVGETIDFLRNADHLPDQFYHVILVDPRMKPQGYVSLGRLLAAARATQLRALAEDSYRTVRGATPEADVAYLFTQYHLISCPVVDADDRLVGVITIDDAMNVLDEEHEEDMLLLAGVGEESSISDGVFETVRQRFPWLFVNLLAANLSALVIAQFQSTIAVFLALAALLPIVASMGGNAGTQSLTVAVRALATRDLTATNAMRVVRREAAVGLINGMGFALMMALVGWYFYDSLALGGVIAVAMVVNLLIAALAGVLVPLIFVRFGMDPAVSSGTFVTTLTDLFGFFTFLGLASLVLM